jgi:crotonobetainyl-CoA:carnitine CoA-transferase CaiB-like acyl-CoA transferase
LCDEATRDKDWLDYANLLYSGAEPIDEYDRLKAIVGEFCMTKTKGELLEAACEKMLLIAPVATPADVVASPQFAAREYFDGVSDEALMATPIQSPGPWFRSTVVPQVRLGRAPRLGEHTDAVRREARSWRPDAPAANGAPRRAPLAGVNVLDLTWAMSGPATTRPMADFGATVVRIETNGHLDAARTVGPFVNDVPGNDSSGLLFNLSTGKRSVNIDLRQPQGRDVLDDLVRWSDVVVESFSPRGRVALDLQYERLRELRPDVIMLSSCLFGQTGPLQRYAGYGTMGASLGGFVHLTGWPDRPPCGPFGAYSDYVSPRYALCTLLAALDHRRHTGEGQYIDFSQVEASVHFLSPAVLDVAVNGRCQTRTGNTDPHMAPHGAYPSTGDDGWVAIACRDDDDWQALAAVLGRDDLAGLTTAERLVRRDELDGIVAAWTAERSAESAADVAITAGVPAHAVQSSRECMEDPQLNHLGHFVTLPHPDHGTIVVEGSRFALSDTPAKVVRTPPYLGQDTVDVLLGELGYDDNRLGELFAANALD